MHDGKMDHAHKEVRPSAYISTHSLLCNTVLPPPFSREQAGTSQIRATSLLLRAPEVMTDFFMCITWPAAHLCGVRLAAFLYIAGKDAR